MDTDSSRTIDKNEALAYWRGRFSAVNAEAMFRSVDKNNNGLIQLDEWLSFWRKIKSAGNTETEIEFEVCLGQRNSWTRCWREEPGWGGERRPSTRRRTCSASIENTLKFCYIICNLCLAL
eukprot:TRINITY_DN2636_c0_g3_i1.p2 TRINITY_DN2636_c0_g3~~TRINITY_DN2636_c0_g3_i1.p2  ORF type:complete len:121 (-),score=0.98 TRINITY_DN2636_c0_g3_i1:101-463(-)